MKLPLRLRVTLAFAACMAILLSALGAFVYVRVASDLTNAIDLDLRSRAQVLIGAVHARDPSLVRESHGSLIDPDEAFAQVLGSDGTIVDSSRGAANRPLITAVALRSVDGPRFVTVPVPLTVTTMVDRSASRCRKRTLSHRVTRYRGASTSPWRRGGVEGTASPISRAEQANEAASNQRRFSGALAPRASWPPASTAKMANRRRRFIVGWGGLAA